MSTDCNSSYVYADPYVGGMIAVSEAARNIVCSGGEPVAITNCLNFGNPYDTEVYYQFVHALKGMGEACRKFNTPVTGGNVSFYNQSLIDGKTIPIYPTPTIGMLGLLDNPNDKMTLNFKTEGHLIYLIGEQKDDINQSEYLKRVHGVRKSPVPYFDLDTEYKLHKAIKQVIKKQLVQSVHDVSEGGIFQTLVESGLHGDLGFEIISIEGFRKDAFLFGESQSRVIVSIRKEEQEAFEQLLKDLSQAYHHLGSTTSGSISVDQEEFPTIQSWKEIHTNSLGEILEN